MRTARAKGLAEIGGAVPPRAARTRMIPILTGVVVVIPLLFLGSLLIGVVLRHPGPGQLHHRRDPGAGLRRRALDGVPRLGALHPRAAPHRHLLHAGRPAGQARSNAVPARSRCGPTRWSGCWSPWSSAYAWYVRRRPHLPRRGGACSQSQGGMSALGRARRVFVVVGLADSLHFRPRLQAAGTAGRDRSTRWRCCRCSILRSRTCASAARRPTRRRSPRGSIAKEQIELPDGKTVRDFPRLRYGGAHLKDEADACRRRRARAALRARRCAASAGALLRVAASRSRDALAAAHGRDVPWRARRRGATLLGRCCADRASRSLALAAALPRARHRQGRPGRALPGAEEHPHRLVIGTLTTLVHAAVRASLLGIMAGYFKGWVDDVIQYLYTTLNSIPGVLLIAAAVLMMQVLHRHASRAVRDRGAARRLAAAPPVRDPRPHQLDRARAAAARRDAEAVASSSTSRRRTRSACATARILARHILPNVDAHRADRDGDGLLAAWCWPRRCCPTSASASIRR